MDSRQTQFEWQVAEDEDEWHELAAMPLSTCRQAQRRRWPSRRRLNVFGLILSLVVCVATVSGYLIWRKAEAGLQLVEREIQETAYIEEWTTHRRALRTAPVQMGGVLSPQHTTMEPPPMPTVEVESANLQGDRVMARVLVERLTAHGDPIIYRETRFYRQTNDGWQRTGPDLALLGPWRTLETKFFLILYPQFHAQTAKEAATRLDAQFVQIPARLRPATYSRWPQDHPRDGGKRTASDADSCGCGKPHHPRADSGTCCLCQRSWTTPISSYNRSAFACRSYCARKPRRSDRTGGRCWLVIGIRCWMPSTCGICGRAASNFWPGATNPRWRQLSPVRNHDQVL